MSDVNATSQSLLSAIDALASKSAQSQSPQGAELYGHAAAYLADAYAHVVSPRRV